MTLLDPARPRRTTSRRPTLRVTLPVLVATGLAMAGAAVTPAAAATKFDGTWTVDNGGTGQVVLNGDGTFTSTCTPLPDFPQAICPAASGTFSFGYTSAYLTFTGGDGTSVTMRWGGPATRPTELTEGGYGQVILDRGTTFQCSLFYDSTYAFARSPLVTTNAKGTQGYALGSHQSVGAINASNYVFLAETSPGFFVKASRCP